MNITKIFEHSALLLKNIEASKETNTLVVIIKKEWKYLIWPSIKRIPLTVEKTCFLNVQPNFNQYRSQLQGSIK